MDAKEMKLILVGQSNVGKTCVVKQATMGNFSEDVTPTLGASYVSKLVTVGETDVRLQIWDTAGTERYKGMAPMYYRGANVALVVYSITSDESFDAVDGWVASLNDNAEPNIVKFLVANKCDCESERIVSTERGQEKAKKFNARYYEVSAKTGQGIEELFVDISKVCIIEESQLNMNTATVKIEKRKDNANKKSGCC